MPLNRVGGTSREIIEIEIARYARDSTCYENSRETKANAAGRLANGHLHANYTHFHNNGVDCLAVVRCIFLSYFLYCFVLDFRFSADAYCEFRWRC